MADQKAKWTVMVYLAGDNNLDGAGVVDLKEMKKVGSSQKVNIVAQFDRIGKRGATKRYFISPGGELEADVVEDLGETNCGDPNTLAEFILWGAVRFPAEHYLVVIWNHGSGWDDENIYALARNIKMGIQRKNRTISVIDHATEGAIPYSRMRSVSSRQLRRAVFNTSIKKALTTRAIAFDDDSRDFLDNIELKNVFSSVTAKLGRKIDVIGLDACLMNMVEVQYQLKDAALFCTGSEEVEPGDGWPYDKILTALAAKPSMTPEEVSKMIVDKYIKSYKAADGVTQSACNMTRAHQVGVAIDGLAKALLDGLSSSGVRMSVVQARSQAQAYYTPQYVDLADLCGLLGGNSTTREIRAASAAVVDSLFNGMVVKSGHKGEAVKNSHGLSIYFPTKKISPLYCGLDFAQKTAWGSFLSEYVGMAGRRSA
ncbi:MAG: peptidase C11 [Nitrospirae bacterium]|nr:MAG: peptidase C11 [Nitrospirota bacterium]